MKKYKDKKENKIKKHKNYWKNSKFDDACLAVTTKIKKKTD